MISKTPFRAYDIRGVVPDQLNDNAAKLIGKAFGTYLIRHHKKKSPTVVVGRDARTHSPGLHEQFIEGLLTTGCDVTDIGFAASPLLYFANVHGGFDGGCNVTASHNPAQYNGFKLMTRNAHAVFGDDIARLYELIEEQDFESGEGQVHYAGFFGDYVKKIESIFGKTDRPLRLVVDCGNGIAGKFYPEVLRDLGHEVIELYCDLDGSFPNHEPDPIVEANLEDLKQKVLETKADIGFSFDGDGDRVGIVTNEGQFINADLLLMLLTQDVLSRHPGRKVVFTVSNSQLLFDLAKKQGGETIMCKVGHSFVENAMHEHQAILGGEQSGHFFLPEDYFGYDDALVTACRVLKIMHDAGKPIGSLFKTFPTAFNEPELRPFCPDDKKFEILEDVKVHFTKQYPNAETMDGIRIDFGQGAWAGIRVSNTSPRLSIIMEAADGESLGRVKDVVLNHLKTYSEIEWNA